MRILVTRAADQAEATAARLAAMGHEAVVAPLTRVVFDRRIALPLGGVGALVATSTNAVEALAGRADLPALARLPLFVVGARTARAARDLGFAEVSSADGDRSDLVRLIAASREPAAGRLLWIAGRDRTRIFADELGAKGFGVDVVEVYRAEDASTFSPEVVAELRAGKIDAIAVYSPRSGALILQALAACGFSPASPGPAIHAISEATARGFRAVWRGDVVVAARPDEAALTETFERPAPVGGAADDRSTDETSTDETRRSRMAPKRTRGTGETIGEAEETAVPETGSVAAEPAPVSETPAPAEGAETAASTEAEAPAVTIAAEASTGTPAEAGATTEPEATTSETSPETPPEIPPAVTPAAIASESSSGGGPGAGTGRIVAAAVVAALVGGGLGIGGSQLLAPSGASPKLEGEIAALKGEIAGLAEVKTRLAAAERTIAAAKPVDTSGLETRIARLEAAPNPAADLAARIDALEVAAKARLDAAKTSVSEALAALPPGAQTQDLAAKVDAALTATREAMAAQTARLEGEIAALSAAAKEQAAKAGSADDLKAAVAATTARIAAEAEKRNGEIAAALEGMRQRLGGVEALRGEVDGLVGRLGGLEVSNKEAKVDRGRIAETIDGAESRVGKVESRIADIQAGAEAARRAQAEAVLAVALADLKSAVDAGRPFRAELEVVKRAMPADGPKLDAVESLADTGVPSLGRLRDEMPAVLRAMHEAEEKSTAGDGVLDRLWAHATQAVRVRPVGDSGGTDLGALVSRVEARMNVGDPAGALAAWQALPEGARKVSAAWGRALEARVSVDAALAAQMSAAVSKLSQPRQ